MRIDTSDDDAAAVKAHARAYVETRRPGDLTASLAAYRRLAQDDHSGTDRRDTQVLAALHRVLAAGGPGTAENAALRAGLRLPENVDEGRVAALAQQLAEPARALAAAQGATVAPLPTAWLDVVAETFAERADARTSSADLSAVIACLRHPRTEPLRADGLSLAGWAHLERHHALGDPRDLAHAVSAFDLARSLPTEERPASRPRLAHAGTAYLEAHQHTGDENHLWTAYTLLKAAVAHDPRDLDARLSVAHTMRLLAEVVTSRDYAFRLSGEAVVFIEESLTETALDDRARRTLLFHLARVLVHRHALTGDPALLDDAVARARGAARDGVPASALLLVDCLLLRGGWRQDPDGIDEGVAALRPVLDAAVDDVTRADCLRRISVAHQAKHAIKGERALLDAAVDIIAEALTLVPVDTPLEATCLSTRSDQLATRHRWYGAAGDLDEAIDLARAADPDGRTPVPGKLLLDRYHVTGDLADLDRAINALRRVARPRAASVLGDALRGRYAHVGDLDDLHEAVALHREVHHRTIHHTHTGDPSCADLAASLLDLFDRTDDPATLKQALACARARAESGTADAAVTLAGALLRRFALDGDRQVLDTAADLLDPVLEQGRAAPGVLAAANLAMADILLTRRREGSEGDLDVDRAVVRRTAARRLLPPGSAEHTRAGLLLAELLVARWQQHRRDADYRTALDLTADPLEHRSLPALDRLKAATLHARLLATGRAPRAEATLAAFRTAVDLIDSSVGWQLSDADRKRRAMELSMLGTDAAASALATGDGELAVEMLERGRFVAWGHMVRDHADLAELRRLEPRLAGRIERARSTLNQLLTIRPPQQTPRWREREEQTGERARQRDHTRTELDALYEQAARALGRAAFVGPADPDALREATRGGTAVIVNVSHLRCDAILIDPRRIRILELTSLDMRDVLDHARRYRDATNTFTRMLAEGDILGKYRAEQDMLDVLAWLWDTVGDPVTRAVAGDNTTPPRVWWCPTGPLAMLPLHAAGRGDEAVSERVVSSYTVTLNHLRLARDRPVAADTGRPLVATISALPDRPDLPRLVGPSRDADVLARRLRPKPVRLDGREITRDRLLLALTRHSWLHIAGHGSQEADPLDSGLHLADGVLTFQDIVAERAFAEAVFLAACHTAVGDTRQFDEGTHLAAALQIAGVRHVIAGLWQAIDHDYAQETPVAGLIYDTLIDDGTLRPDRAAHAVHHALRELRRTAPFNPTLWAPYLHFGP